MFDNRNGYVSEKNNDYDPTVEKEVSTTVNKGYINQLFENTGMDISEVSQTELEGIDLFRLFGNYHFVINHCGDMSDNTDAVLKQAIELTHFDQKLKDVVLPEVLRVEEWFRARLRDAYVQEYGNALLQREQFPSLQKGELAGIAKNCAEEMRKQHSPIDAILLEDEGEEQAVKRFEVLVQHASFGTKRRLYTGADDGMRHCVSLELGITPEILDSWLAVFVELRNTIAHSGTLWNKSFEGTTLVIPNTNECRERHILSQVDKGSLFACLTVLTYVIKRLDPDTSLQQDLRALFMDRSNSELEMMGFKMEQESFQIWTADTPSLAGEINAQRTSRTVEYSFVSFSECIESN